MTIHRKVWRGGGLPVPFDETRLAGPWRVTEGETIVVTHSNPEGTGPRSEPIDPPRASAQFVEPSREPLAESRRVQIINGLGFHLRPIQQFVTVVLQHRSEVEVRHEGKCSNGRSVLDLMSLAAECGTEMELAATGTDAQEVLDALAALFAARFHEDDFGQPLPLSSP